MHANTTLTDCAESLRVILILRGACLSILIMKPMKMMVDGFVAMAVVVVVGVMLVVWSNLVPDL